METGDHWLLYATVQDGKVLDEATPAAVHFRKVGSNY
jgi:flavin reductase (DIM6/NTAB) family NADH-FMN oxidoreductase RutF